jgi:hypothetical protein
MEVDTGEATSAGEPNHCEGGPNKGYDCDALYVAEVKQEKAIE